jgi:WD40 repeat protein
MSRHLAACAVALLLAVPGVGFGAEPANPLTPLTEHEWGVQVLAFSPDGKYLFSGCEQGTIRLTDVSSKEVRQSLKAHPSAEKRGPFASDAPHGVLALAVSRDGATLYSGGGDERLLAWNTKTGKETVLLKDIHVTALTLSPDGKTLAATGYDNDLRLLDTAGKAEPRKLQGGPARITAALFSADGKTLYTGGVTANVTFPNIPVIESDVVRTWDVASGREGPSLRVRAHRLAAAADGRTFLASAAILRVRKGPLARGAIGIDDISLDVEYVTQMWDSRSDKRPGGLTAQGKTAILSPDGKTLVTVPGVDHYLEVGINGGNFLGGDFARKVRGWDLSSGQLLFELSVKGPTAAAFSPDGRRLAVGTDQGKVLLCDMEALKKEYRKPRAEEDLWKSLADASFAECCAAMWTLSRGGNRTVKWLEQQMLLPADFDARPIRRLIKELDDDDFQKREDASAALEKLGPRAYHFVREALGKKPTAEAGRRLQELADKYADRDGQPAPELCRALRAVSVLEEIDTPEARELLKKAAGKEAIFPIQQQAEEALKRLEAAGREKK